ncbi:MAG: sodium/proline symporter [Bacteroidota bacterium]
MDQQGLMLGIMLTYLTVLMFIGIYVGRKVKSSSDYAISGRNLPGWVAALSERATAESAWALLGLPGAAYALGLTEMWTALGCAIGIILSWLFLSQRIRKEADKYQADTFMEFIGKRHGRIGKLILITGSLIIAFFFFFYVAAQFIGGGKTIQEMFGININAGILIIAVFVIPYTIYGGFRSVAYTDVIQALLMIITLVIGPIVGIFFIANNPDVFATSIPEALQKSGEQYSNLTGLTTGLGAGVVIMTGLSWMFGYLGGMPQLTIRYMAIRDSAQAKIARNIAISWTVFAYTGALLIGLLGIAIFGPASGDLSDVEAVMPAVIFRIFPPLIATILVTGAFAAMISTANSLLILSSTEISENIINKSKLRQKFKLHNLSVSRITTGVLAIAALVLAYLTKDMLIYNLVKYAWAGIGDTFSVIIILTLFWKRFHGKAALLTMIIGFVFTVVWIQTGMEDKYISCLVLTFVVALLTAVISTLAIKK